MLTIHESFLARPPKFPNPNTSGSSQQQQQQPPLQSWMAPDMRRFEVYQRCLTSVKAWLDRVFAWPIQFCLQLPAGNYLQMFYVIVCLQKLTTIQDPAWNVDAVRSVVDLFPTIDRILGLCEELRKMTMAQDESGGGGGASSSSSNGNNNSNGFYGGPLLGAIAIEKEDSDPILVAIRKFTTLKIIWQNEMAYAREREREPPAADQGYVSSSTAGPGSSAMEISPGLDTGVGPGVAVSGVGSAAAAAAAGVGADLPMLLPGQTPTGVTDGLNMDFFSNYSLGVLDYFYALPGMGSDQSWS